jgi:hypothetical protein
VYHADTCIEIKNLLSGVETRLYEQFVPMETAAARQKSTVHLQLRPQLSAVRPGARRAENSLEKHKAAPFEAALFFGWTIQDLNL